MGIRELYEKSMQDFIKRRNDESKKINKKLVNPIKKAKK